MSHSESDRQLPAPTNGAVVPARAQVARSPEQLIDELSSFLTETNRVDQERAGRKSEAPETRPYDIDDDEFDDTPMPIPSTWLPTPVEPPRKGWFAEQAWAAALGFTVGLIIVVPAILFLTARFGVPPKDTKSGIVRDGTTTGDAAATPSTLIASAGLPVNFTQSPPARLPEIPPQQPAVAAGAARGTVPDADLQPLQHVGPAKTASSEVPHRAPGAAAAPSLTKTAPPEAPTAPVPPPAAAATAPQAPPAAPGTARQSSPTTAAGRPTSMTSAWSAATPSQTSTTPEARLGAQQELKADLLASLYAPTQPLPAADQAREPQPALPQSMPGSMALTRISTAFGAPQPESPRIAVVRVKPVATASLAAASTGQQLDPPDLMRKLPTLAEAKRLIASGKVPEARRALAQLASGGEPKALFALAETYDPNMLAAWSINGVPADAGRARQFYGIALARGVEAARQRLKALE